MNRLAVCTVAAVAAAAIAVFDLVSAWTIQMGTAALVVSLGLFVIAVALYGALLVIGVGERRGTLASAASSVEIVGRAARSVRWSALAGIALSVLLFANCSASVSSGPPRYSGPMDDVSGFLAGSAEVFLPVIVVISLVAALATVAERYATRRQWSSAQRAAQVAIWSLVTLAIVAAATVPVGFIFLASQCLFGTSSGACSAGTASFTNVFLAAAFALLLPYILMMMRAVRSSASPAPGSAETD
jgi:hypothetical protein